MITLWKKPRKDSSNVPSNSDNNRRASVRDRLLIKEVQEMEINLPKTCRLYFDDPDVLSEFFIYITPDEGFWINGKFKFHVVVPEDYNMAPPKVKCCTKLWHPNISVTGDICLSILRQNSIDSLGWAPTRSLKDVIWGINSLFTDLLNFEDPLNIEAADQYVKDKIRFNARVREFISLYAEK